MKKYSLYSVALGIFLILAAVSFILIYFTLNLHRKDLLEKAVEEKIRLAAVINETISSPVWIHQIPFIPGLEKTFLMEIAKFKDVKYIRIVESDGSIYKSSIKGEKGKAIKDPDIEKALTTRKTIVKDKIFKGEKLKTIIYPDYQNRAILVVFSLKSVEEVIKARIIRDTSIALGGLLVIILIVFLIFRNVVNPLKKMIATCQKIRKGNLEVKAPVSSITEISELAGTFNEMVKDLKESHATLEEAKTVLKIKVKARTRELRELAERREEIIEQRTKEIRKRVEELEKFHRLAVGRELKMIELKKEIEKLKKELKRKR